MTDTQKTESGTQRLLQVGTTTLTVLSPVINMLAARLADRLERSGTSPVDVEDAYVVEDDGEKTLVVKQPLSDTLQERGEVLVQDLEDLVERGTKLSQVLMTRSSEMTHDLVERGTNASQDLMTRSKEVRKELGKRGKKLNKDLNKRSQQVAKELNKPSQHVTKHFNKRSQQATRQISERNGTFWVISGFVVGLSAAGIAAYLLIRQRVQQQQQLEAEQSYPVSQNGYLNIHASSVQAKDTSTTTTEPIVHQPVVSALVEENTPMVAVVDQEDRAPVVTQAIPASAAFIGIVETRRYYPVVTPLEQLVASNAEKNDVIYFTTEEEAKAQGYSSGL